MRTALITGSSKGLGRSLALEFAKHGYNIILHGRDLKRLEEVRKAIRRKGRKCEFVAGDINSLKTENALFDIAKLMKLKVLINNAAIYSNAPIHRVPRESYQALIDTNLVTPISMTAFAFHLFQLKKEGLIININSIAGKRPGQDEAVYCASKYGLRGFSESIKPSAAEFGIRILDVYLGAVRTDMVKNRPGFKKFIYPEEAAAVIFALSQTYKSLTIREVEIGRRNY